MLKYSEIAKGVYKITNVVNAKVYIGSSSRNIKERWNKHCSHLKLKQHSSQKMQNDYDKFGIEVFRFDVIQRMDNKSPEEILEKEQFYINLYKSYGKNGYNSSSIVNGGNIRNLHVAIYNKYGEFIELVPSCNLAVDKYNYTGILKNINYNKQHRIKLISKIGYAFVAIKDVENISNTIQVEEKDKRIIVLYSLMDDKVIRYIGSYKQYLIYYNNKYKTKLNASSKVKNMSILTNTNGYTYCEQNSIKDLYKHQGDLMCLCCFDSNGNFLSKDISKTFASIRYNLKSGSINSCSRANNNHEFKTKMRTYSGYIFKHYKLSKIPKRINVITGETLLS